MSKRFLTPVGLFSAASDPASGSAGNIYFNSSSNVIRIYYNSQWNTIHNGTASLGFNTDYIDFSTNPTVTASTARLQWSAGEGTLSFGLGGGDIFLNIGQEELAYCYNGTASTMTKGTVVYISGAQGQRPTIDKASADGEGESSKTLGVTAEDIPSGSQGFICTSGVLRNVNTASFPEGSALWLSTTPGQMTTSKLYAPNHLVFIGYSIKQSANAGQIFVKIQNGLELYELHNVSASAPSNNDILVYNGSSSLWFNSSSANLANLTVTNTINGRAASANVATHAGTASSIAGSLVTGYVASATVATHAGTASSINASLLTGTTLPAAIVNSSLTSVGTLSYLAVSGSAVLNQLAEVRISSSTGFFDIHGGLRVGDYNNIVQSGDKGIIFTDGTANTGGFVIAPWSDQNYGIRISAASLVAINGNLNVDSGALYVDHINNRVGVNTTNPSQSLAVVGTASITSTLNVGSTTTISSTTGRVSFGLDAGGNVNIGRIDNAASTPFIDFNSGSVSGDFDVRIQATGGAGATSGRGTLAITASLVTINNLLNVDSGTLYVDSVSNEVGIGTTSPDGKLDIATDTDKDVVAGISTAPAITFRNGAGAWFHAGKPFSGDYFQISNGASPGVTNNLVITSGGNVGIATTNPNQTLTVVGTASITSNLTVGGTITGTSTTQAVGNSSTSLATTEFVSRSVKYSADTSVNTSSVAGFFVFNVSGTASLGGVIMMPRGTAARVLIGQANTGINGVASAGFVRGYVENNAGTAIAVGNAVPFYYMAW